MRRVDLIAAGGLRFVGWLSDRTPRDVRLIQAYDPRDERHPRSLRRQVFFVRLGDAAEFSEQPVYGLEREAEVPQ